MLYPQLILLSYVKQVLIRLIGADETMYNNYMDSMQWLEEIDMLEMIVDKFSSSVSIRKLSVSFIKYLCLR